MNNILYKDIQEDSCEDSGEDINSSIVYDIVDDIYKNINNNNIKDIFEDSYVSFIEFINCNILSTESYNQDENINKYTKLYINLLYNIIYMKASCEEELLNNMDYSFFEFYNNYTPSKNIRVISDTNTIYNELDNILFTISNLHILQDYVYKFVNLYIYLINETK